MRTQARSPHAAAGDLAREVDEMDLWTRICKGPESAMKAFAVGLIGSALVGLLLRDANVTVAGYFVIGIAAGWVGRGWIGLAWLVGGTVTAWLALGLVERLGIAGTMWGTATAPRGAEATLWLLMAVLLILILIVEVLGYGVGVATIRLARRWGPS